MAAADSRAGAAGVAQLDARLRHGDFVETAIELQAEAGLYVLGEHHHAQGTARVRSDHHLEQVIRGVARSVLVGMVIPPLLTFNGRGLHDLAAGTRTVAI